MDYEAVCIKKDDFLLHLDVERNVARNTYKSYQYDLNQFLRFWKQLLKKDATLCSIQQALEEFFLFLYKQKVSRSSISRKIACFKSFEKYLHNCNLMINLKLTAPRVEKKLPVYLTIENINYILDTMPDEDFLSKRPIRDRAIIELLYATGMRCAELITVTMRDINFDQKTILIQGKGNKERIVLFGNKAKQRILEYMSTERIQDACPNSNALFFMSGKAPISSRTLQLLFNKINQMLPFQKNLTPHKIRHSFATHLLNAGMDLRALQELLGHASLSTTEKYTHISPKDLYDLYEKFNPLAALNLKLN
jgi:site-specific recombinase XerD